MGRAVLLAKRAVRRRRGGGGATGRLQQDHASTGVDALPLVPWDVRRTHRSHPPTSSSLHDRTATIQGAGTKAHSHPTTASSLHQAAGSSDGGLDVDRLAAESHARARKQLRPFIRALTAAAWQADPFKLSSAEKRGYVLL